MFPRGECKYCHADVVWATLDSGKRLPFDFDPVPSSNRQGTFILWQDLGEIEVRAQRARDFESALRPIYRERYVPHPVTCNARRG